MYINISIATCQAIFYTWSTQKRPRDSSRSLCQPALQRCVTFDSALCRARHSTECQGPILWWLDSYTSLFLIYTMRLTRVVVNHISGLTVTAHQEAHYIVHSIKAQMDFASLWLQRSATIQTLHPPHLLPPSIFLPISLDSPGVRVIPYYSIVLRFLHPSSPLRGAYSKASHSGFWGLHD